MNGLVTSQDLPTPASQPMTVACLCAQWCVACREWSPVFTQLASDHANHHWVSVDIEDHDGLEVENFPTLLILDSNQDLCFWGTVVPRAEAWLRLIQAAQTGQLRPAATGQALWATFGQTNQTLGLALRLPTP